jgi:hypothetical protein
MKEKVLKVLQHKQCRKGGFATGEETLPECRRAWD